MNIPFRKRTVLLVLLAACGTSPETPAREVDSGTAHDPGALFCAAKAVFDAKCISCHDGHGTGGSPMGLTSYDDLTAEAVSKPGTKVWERVDVRIHVEQAEAEGLGPMPPGNDLSPEQLAAVEDWIEAGAPPPAETCESSINAEQVQGKWPPDGCDALYTLSANDGAGGKFQVEVGESHPQVILDAPWGDEDVQAIGFKPVTDNAKVLHHWILYGNSGDAALPGLAAGPFLTGWAPGDDARAPFPADVGMQMPKGKQSLRLDLHYFNKAEGATVEKDASGAEVCVVFKDHFRKNSAAVTQYFANIANLRIPRNTSDYVVSKDCEISANEPVHLMTANPHAHKLATWMKFTVKKKDGTVIVMHDHSFRFGEQRSYSLTPEVILETGDVVTTECTYSNPTDQDVTFGESTTSEMCFNFASYYPADSFFCWPPF